MAGKLSDERFALMSKTYEDEQTQLKAEIQTLQQEIEVQERQIENLEQFIQRVHKYEDLQEMTPYALRELVKASTSKRLTRAAGSADRASASPMTLWALSRGRTDETGNGMTEAMPFLQKQYYFLMTPDHSSGVLFY